MNRVTSIADELEAQAARLLSLAARLRAGEAPEDGADGTNGAAPGPLLTAAQVVQSTGLSRGRVYDLARRGEAGAVRVGERGVRFSESGLRSWLAAGGSK